MSSWLLQFFDWFKIKVISMLIRSDGSIRLGKNILPELIFLLLFLIVGQRHLSLPVFNHKCIIC